jgi:hypothetical protein
MKKTYLFTLLFLLIPFAFAAGNQNSSGMTSGEVVLDSVGASSYHVAPQAGGYLAETLVGNTLPGRILYNIPVIGNVLSSALNNFAPQAANKDNAQNQNVDLDVAKKNLENSKDNVAMMFSYIVDTFEILFDAIISIIYIFILSGTIWIIFVGYIRFLCMIIYWIKGKVKYAK